MGYPLTDVSCYRTYILIHIHYWASGAITDFIW